MLDWTTHTTGMTITPVSWDITGLVNDWYSGAATNYGVMIKRHDVDAGQSTGGYFYSSEYSSYAPAHPYLQIIYRNSNGNEGISSQRSLSVGRAGNVYLNDYTGNLNIMRNDIGFDGNVMPVNISMIYSTAAKDVNVTNCSGGFDRYGTGWRTSYNQTIKYYAINSNNYNTVAYYEYTTEDGSVVYFEDCADTAHPSASFVDSSGSGYTLSVSPTSLTDYTKVAITTPSGQILSFDNPANGSIGRLVKISGNAQTIRHIVPVAGNDYYSYVTGSGTEIFFDEAVPAPDLVDSSGLFTDAGASGYVLTVTPGSLDDMTKVTVTNPETEETITFDSTGNIATLNTDTIYVGSVNITYDTSETVSCAIDHITDGVGRLYRFTYDGTTKRLTRIDYKGVGSTVLKAVYYIYNTDNTLNHVVYPYYATYPAQTHATDKKVYYTWNTDKTLLSIKNTDNYRLTFDYIGSIFRKVNNIYEYGSAGDAGTWTNVYYIKNSTKYTDIITGKTMTLQFDNYGNVLSVQDNSGNAIFGSYDAGGGSSANPNRIIGISNLQKTSVNLLNNGIAYSDLSWTGAGFCSVATDQKLIGSSSFKFLNASATTSSYSQSVSLTAGKDFILSAYVKTDNVVGTDNNGAKLDITATNGGDITITKLGEIVTGTNDWKRIYIAFHTNNATTLTSWLKLLTASGTAWFDEVQLEYANTTATIGPARYNLVENSGFEKTTYTGGYYMPNSWTYGSSAAAATSNVTVTASSSPAGANYMKLYGTPLAGNEYITQTIDVSGVAGDQYSFGGWAKSLAVPLTDAARTFEIRAELLGSDGTTVMETYHAQFEPTIADWQYSMSGFYAQNAYSKIRITVDYAYQSNTSWFDGIQLYKEAFGTNFTYDDDGNLIDTQDVTQTTPADDGNIMNNVDSRSAYEADSFGNTTKSVTDEGVECLFAFDGYSNQLRSVVTNGRQTIETSAAYTSDGNYLSTTTDELGNETGYSFSSSLGVLDSIIDADAKTTSYGYDAWGNLNAVSKTAGSNTLATSYDYDAGDRLTTITHNGFGYSFGYNTFGVPTTVSVGAQTLLTNSYDTFANGYTLDNTAYGNGNTLHYAYDGNNNLSSVTYNSEATPRYCFYYDSDGSIASIVDTVNSIQTSYTITSEGNRKVTQTGTNTHSYWLSSNGYNTGAFNEVINDTTYVTNLVTDKDGRANGASYTLPDGTTAGNETAFDDLGRTLGMNLFKTNAAGTVVTNLLTASYNYSSLPKYKTSNQVSVINLRNSSGYSKVLTYLYDKLGNITSDNGKTYVYDEAGELTRVNDPANGTIVYAYDAGGNITSKTSYAYTTGTPGTVLSTVSYGYDATWKDKLTTYNGSGITYDAIGNPLSYYNGYTFSWSMGRELSGVTGDGKIISYKYDENGYRTQKTVNGTTTDYILKDGRVDFQTDGTDSFYFRYDGNDNPVGFEWNGTDYYYVRNLQGDILSILDSTGAAVVEYTYDAWGKILTTTGTLATTLGAMNPLLYRGYYYDTETGFYSLQSRYYDPEIGRFINADVPEMMLLSDNILGTNLFAYCNNNPINYSDPSGHLAANVMKLVNGFSAATIFSSYMTGLYTAMTATLTKIGLWVTGILAPKIAAIFWWQPWLVAGIVVTAVAIVVGAVTIYLNSQMNKTVEEVLKTKKGSIKNAPLPPGGPNWKDLLKKTMKEIKDLAQKGVKGYKEIWKLLTDSRFNK